MLQQKCEPIKKRVCEADSRDAQASQSNSIKTRIFRVYITDQTGEFDPGSERTLAAGLTHASRA